MLSPVNRQLVVWRAPNCPARFARIYAQTDTTDYRGGFAANANRRHSATISIRACSSLPPDARRKYRSCPQFCCCVACPNSFVISKLNLIEYRTLTSLMPDWLVRVSLSLYAPARVIPLSTAPLHCHPPCHRTATPWNVRDQRHHTDAHNHSFCLFES